MQMLPRRRKDEINVHPTTQSSKWRRKQYHALLVAVVKMQRIADRAYGILPTPGLVKTYRASRDMAIDHVKHEIDVFAYGQPHAVKQNSKQTVHGFISNRFTDML
jgi:hypothetical protein